MKKLLVILGPTALGKTDLSLKLAKKFNGEVVACDSRQVYKGLNLGTGKGKEKVWMYGVLSPKKQYSVAEYVKDAAKIVENILGRQKLPIIVAGTGLYLKGLLGDIDNLNIGIDKSLRKKLQKFSIEKLQKTLMELSPVWLKRMNRSDINNSRRLIRAIELVNAYPLKNQKSKAKNQKWDVLKIGLIAPREIINKRIDARLYKRIKQGLIKEAQNLHKVGLSYKRMRELGLEYKYLADYLEGKISYGEFVKILKVKIHQFAKRQIIWFKKEKDVNWFDITSKKFPTMVDNLVTRWYNSPK